MLTGTLLGQRAAQLVAQQDLTTVLAAPVVNDPEYKLFLTVFGGIAAFAFTAAFLGCCAAMVCRRRRQRREKEAAALALDAGSAVWTPTVSTSTLNRTDSTLIGADVEAQHDIITRRASNLMNNDAFYRRELEWCQYGKQQKKRSRGPKSSSIMLPVILDDLRQWAKRHTASGDRPEEPVQPPPPSPAPVSGPSRDIDGAVTSPSPAKCNSSNDYDNPSELLEQICPRGGPVKNA